MRSKYNKHGHRRPRSENFRALPSPEVEKRIHNAVAETRKHDHDVNSVRRLIAELMGEEDVEPGIAVEALMSVAAQVYKVPPPGMKKRGVLRFARLAWRCFRQTRIEEPVDE